MTAPNEHARKAIDARGILIALVVVALVGLAAGGLARLRVETSVDSFLSHDDPATVDLADHARSFGGNPVVAILESKKPGGLLVDEGQLSKVIRLEGELARLPDVAAVYGPGTVLNQIATVSQNLLVRVGGARDALRAAAEAKAKAKANHASPQEINVAVDAATAEFDNRYGSLIARGLPAGLPTMRNPKFAESVIYGEAGEPRPRWHFVVPDKHTIVLSVRPRQDIDEGGNRRLVAAVRDAVDKAGLNVSRVTVTGVPAITSALTGEAQGEIPLLGGLAMLVLLIRFLVAPARGGWRRRLWPLAAALVGSLLALAAFGWAGVALSFAAVVLLPLLLGIGSSFPLYLATVASRRKVIVVSLASAAAFASLSISPLPFVRELGLALGLGVVLTVAATVLLGRALDLVPPAAPAHGPTQRGKPPGTRRLAVLGCCVVLAGLGWAALPRLDMVASPESMAQGLDELDQARYAEGVLGSSGEVSIVLRGTDTQSPAALAWLVRAQDVTVARHGDQLRPILTAPDLLAFLGDKPTAEQIAAGVELLPPYLTSAVLTPDGGNAVLTFGLKLQDLGPQSRLLADVQSALPPPPPGTTVDLVGLPVAAARTYQNVSSDRFAGNVAGIVAAGLVLLVGLRNRWYAGAAVLAGALATGWAFAGLWLLGQSLNPLTLALGSLATVTACEFTVLLAESVRLRRPTLGRTVAWACATSVVGYLALVPSRIGLLREFGLTLAVTMLLSYLAALAVVQLYPRRERVASVERAEIRERALAGVSS